jgi:hypothetical protein
MSIDDIFTEFVEENGGQAMWDQLVQLWWYVMLNDEETILELIDDLKMHYEDPEMGEIALIALWQRLAAAKKSM